MVGTIKRNGQSIRNVNVKPRRSKIRKKNRNYPDLEPIIDELHELALTSKDERLTLFNKWINKLSSVDLEIRKLEKMDNLTKNLSSKKMGID